MTNPSRCVVPVAELRALPRWEVDSGDCWNDTTRKNRDSFGEWVRHSDIEALFHFSDCPTNNAPALPVGKCDCAARPDPSALGEVDMSGAPRTALAEAVFYLRDYANGGVRAYSAATAGEIADTIANWLAKPVSAAPLVCTKLRPGTFCPTPESCRENGCDAVERELFNPSAIAGEAG